jgi:hypothetical protein
MAKVRIRKLSEVPPPPPALPKYRNRRFAVTDEFEEYVLALDGTKVGEVRLEASDELPLIKSRLKRVAARVGREIRVWEARGKLYFGLDQDGSPDA